MKCDPCVATAPSVQDLVQAGVWWIMRDWNDYSDVNNDEEDYSDKVFFTRLHIRYNRNSFPQDLMFQTTANNENFQARYIITHPASGNLDCDQGKKISCIIESKKNPGDADINCFDGQRLPGLGSCSI